MRVVLITQDDPFYLGETIEYLIGNFPRHSEIVACVLFEVSPFGKKETMTQKAKKTLSIFGFPFFVHYSFKFLLSKFNRAKQVRSVLARRNVPIIQLTKSINHDESLEIIRGTKPDLLISIAGNQIFKKKLIELAPKGCLNLHTALLPKYRGLMPSFWVLWNNETHTGVSVFFVDEGIDSGPILVQKKFEIGTRSQEELIAYSKKVGMDAIVESVELIETGNYQLIENSVKGMTYYSFPTRKNIEEFLARGKRFF